MFIIYTAGASCLQRSNMTSSVPNLTQESPETTYKYLNTQVDAMTVGHLRRSQKGSIDWNKSRHMPEGSDAYLEALREFSASPDGYVEETVVELDNEPSNLFQKLKPLKSDTKKKGSSRFASKAAEEICIKNFKFRYPKYMQALVLNGNMKLEPLILPETCSAPSSPPMSPEASERSFVTTSITSSKKKVVSWGRGEVFTFDNLPPVNGSWDANSHRTVLGMVPEDGSDDAFPLDSPPRLRRVRSAKSRPKPSMIELTRGLGKQGR